MDTWRDLARAGRFEEAEPSMLTETEGTDGRAPDAETCAWFYESWGDALGPDVAAEAKYREAEHYFWMFASWSTSGGEGTARMRDLGRVREKIAGFQKR